MMRNEINTYVQTCTVQRTGTFTSLLLKGDTKNRQLRKIKKVKYI